MLLHWLALLCSAGLQLECPGFLGDEHGIVETHRKQHHPAALPLLGKRLGDLVLHPVAGDGRRRGGAPLRSAPLKSGQEIAILRGVRVVAAIEAWLAASGITSGPVFRAILKGGRLQDVALSGHSAAAIVKAKAELAGLVPHSQRPQPPTVVQTFPVNPLTDTGAASKTSPSRADG